MAAKLLTFIFLFGLGAAENKLTLKQVVILGRHNVRAPLTSNLEMISPKIWPKWDTEIGFLTEKGAMLESFMGEYFSLWLKKEGLFSGCPRKDSVYLRANVKHRTRESARLFIKSAFKHCNLTVFVKNNVKSDPLFHPIVRNVSESFLKAAKREMRDKLDKLHLEQTYSFLNEVLDFQNSRTCKESSFCDLETTKDEILLRNGEEPDIYGPLHVGNSAVDAFLMSYYNGSPLEEIAWGKISNDSWQMLTQISKENQNVRFNNTMLSRHLARPLLKVIYKLLSDDKLKFCLLVGHDSNLNSVLSSIGFKPFDLEGQYEKTPVGGKLVFQKWYDENDDKLLFKISFVYQSTEQLRLGSKLNIENPPKFVNLEAASCKADERGFCPWDDFLNILDAIQ